MICLDCKYFTRLYIGLDSKLLKDIKGICELHRLIIEKEKDYCEDFK